MSTNRGSKYPLPPLDSVEATIMLENAICRDLKPTVDGLQTLCQNKDTPNYIK